MKESVVYIHFEGMDLSGKSVVAKRLTELNPEWELRRGSLLTENPIYQLANSMLKRGQCEEITLGYLYLCALRYDLNNFIWPVRPTVQDSTIFLRSLVYHTEKNTPGVLEGFRDLILEHPRFSASFMLTASIVARKDRLRKRMLESPGELSAGDMLVITDPVAFQKREDRLITLAQKYFNSEIVDTTEKDIGAVVEEVTASIYQGNPELLKVGQEYNLGVLITKELKYGFAN